MLRPLLFLLTVIISQNASASEHSYHLAFSETLDEVSVRLVLSDPESSLRARDSYSAIFTKRPLECESGETLSYRNSRIYLNENTRCIEYSASLNQKQDRRPFGLSSKAMVTTPAEWLFLPRLRATEQLQINVKTPAKMNFSAPWERISIAPRKYRLRASPQSADGLIVLGEFEQREVAHKSTNLRIAYLPGGKTDYDVIDAWLKATVDNVSKTYGRFPHPSPQIIISPVAQALSYQRSPVPFGRVVRDYGESVQFFIDQRQDLKQFKSDWTATHEFAHLMLPYIDWNNRWLSEGFASYYQNVLMARGGEYSEEKAWQKIYEGFKRGERAAPELSPNSAAREGWGSGAGMKVYWSGAALALLADVRLREISNGKKSLDSTLDALQKCCLPSSRKWTGTQLMRKLDQLSESKVFTELYTEYANQPGFFPYAEAFEKLDIEVKRNRLILRSDNREKVELRKTIISER